MPVLLCSVRGTLYAYRDACAACGSSLAEATLTAERLSCAACGASYDVRAAGRGLAGRDDHLDPLPLLADSQGVRVAVPAQPEAVRS
jgi:nitrite reductase/ring-hydroxylating ferredoxin subunit